MAQAPNNAGLMSIPREVRVKILQYVLQGYSPATTWDQCASKYINRRIMGWKGEDETWIRTLPAPNHHSIFLVNRQLSAEAKRLMYCQSFQYSIQEALETFNWMVSDMQFERLRSIRTLLDFPYFPVSTSARFVSSQFT